jgi:hypothetical protein
MTQRILGVLLLGLAAAAVVAAAQRSEDPASATGTAGDRANEITLTDVMKRDVGAGVRSAGYNCPEPKLAYRERPDAYGDVVQLFCGPAGIDGVYADFSLRITFRPDGRISIAPWN